MLLLFALACAPDEVDLAPTRYGPDCLDAYEPPAVCACEVAVDWAGVDPARVDVVVLDEPALIAAGETCSGGVGQSSVLEAWSVGVMDVGAGSGTFDVRPYLGASFGVFAYDHDGGVVGWALADVVQDGDDAVLLE